MAYVTAFLGDGWRFPGKALDYAWIVGKAVDNQGRKCRTENSIHSWWHTRIYLG